METRGITGSLLVKAGRIKETRHFTEAPVYIGGCGRSGTTLLLSILSSHPEIFGCPGELNLFADPEIRNEKIYLPKFYRLYRCFLTKHIKKTANRYCEKSPANVQKIDIIDRYHQGNFRLIHIIRDGRDVVLSKHPKRPETYWVEPARWVRDVSIGLQFRDHPCVFTIHYEDLVTDYEESVRKLCEFLKIPLTEEILNWHSYTTVRRNRALQSSIQQLSSASIGKYSRPENKSRLDEFMRNEEAVELLSNLGY